MSDRWRPGGVLLAALAIAGPARAASPTGDWQGSYRCVQGETALHLAIRPAAVAGGLEATFSFGATPGNRHVPAGCFAMAGTVDVAGGAVAFRPTGWISQPPGYEMVGLSGRLAPDGAAFTGRITGGVNCTTFHLARTDAPLPAASPCDGPAIGV